MVLRRLVVLTVGAVALVSCGGDDPGDDAQAAPATTTTTVAEPTTTAAPAGPAAGPALADWDGRRYDFGTASNARPVDGGHVVDWDRFGLLTVDEAGELRDPDAFSSDVVEPWDAVVHLSDAPFRNDNDLVRQLTVTDAAWAFEVVEEELRCPGAEDGQQGARAPWREVPVGDWLAGLPADDGPGPLVVLMYDAAGRVVQIRPVAGC